MSAPPSIDAYDAQMLDFSSDHDVPMHITASAEFFAEALMDHDGHLDTLPYGEHASVEVDMEEYVGDNAEYEMADETADYHRSHGDELLDIEVFDASHAPSPLIPLQPLQPPVDVPIDSEHPESTAPAFLEHATLPELPSEPEVEVHPAPLGHPAADTLLVEPAVVVDGVSSDLTHELARPAGAPVESVVATSESHEQLGDPTPAEGQTLDTPAPVEPSIPPLVEEHATGVEVARHETAEPAVAESVPPKNTEDTHDGDPPTQEKTVDQEPAIEGEAVDPLRISDGVYIDPPPAVLLSIANLSEPEFALFNQPEVEGEFAEEAHEDKKVCSLLLENRPTLYYEPLSSVFETFRQDEDLLSRIPNSFEGELVLDAYDLQLAISEDNIHSREISLHDLNILHDGSDFAGPLRLLIRTNVPRFIIRFYALQEQIQRLNVAPELGGGEHGEEHHDISGERPHSRQQEAMGHSSTVAVVVSEHLEVPSATEDQEHPVKELVTGSKPSEENAQENYEPDDTSAIQEPAAEYHEVTEEAVHDLEDEDDYEGTNAAAGEDESAESESLDANQVHETAAQDTDAHTATGQESEFGGEQTEYLDYVQPEEYDECYDEDLPERARGTSAVQYGEPLHYEEGGEQDTSTVVDESQVVLPSSDDDEDKSVATPIPTRAVLESEPTDDNAIDEPALAKQKDTVLSSNDLATSVSTKEVKVVEVSGNQEPRAAQAKIFSEVEESDSNFVSMLEREADAEFDQTFNPERSVQDGGVESALQHEEAWDEWDDEDAEGEDEEDCIDPDAASNESSVTLSSKASSKRSYDEVEPSEEFQLENPQSSPGSKRPRVE